MSDALPCVCGLSHAFPDAVRLLLQEMNSVAGPTISVQTPGGTFRVPRVYIAAHGIKADELPRVARVHGFEKVAQN